MGISFNKSTTLTCIFTVASFLRGYFIRRLFNNLELLNNYKDYIFCVILFIKRCIIKTVKQK